MAESTLSLDYGDYARLLNEEFGGGTVFDAGTVTISSGVVTFTTARVPTWAADFGWLQIGTTLYEVNTRGSSSEVTLVDTSVDENAGTPFALFQVQSEEDWQRIIQSNIKAGLHSFYYPENGHQWSFLHPIDSVTTVADTDEYTLPDDYGGIEGRITYAEADGGYGSIKLVNEEVIRRLRAHNGTTNVSGYPTMAAIQSVPGTSGANFDNSSEGQRFKMLLWPTPNAAFTLSFQKVILPDLISPANPYPYGGQVHAHTIRSAMLAQGELMVDGQPGRHTEEFMRRLQSSIAKDGTLNQPEFLGYNGNREMFADERWPHQLDYDLVTYDGSEYDGT